MATSERISKTLSASDARQQFASMINEIAQEGTRVVIEKNGAPVAAIVPIADLVRLKLRDERNRELLEKLSWIGEPFREIPPEEVEAETARILAEIREKDHLARQHAATNS